MDQKEEKMKEGFYHLYNPSEKEPVLVHGYYCTDMGGRFVFGFNTHDGGGLLPLSDLTEDSRIVPVSVVETRPSSFLNRDDLLVIKRGENIIGHKFLCTENDNEINFYHVDGDVNDGEFHIGNVTGVGGWWVIGKKDLKECLSKWDMLMK